MARFGPAPSTFQARLLPIRCVGREYTVATTTVFLAVLAAVFALSHVPLLRLFFADLGRRDQYAFCPLLLVAAAVLALDRLRSFRPCAVRRSPPTKVVTVALAASVMLASIGGVCYLRWLAAPSALLALAAVVWHVGGSPLAQTLFPCMLLLLTVVPPPMRLDADLTFTLRGLAVRLSSTALDLLRQPHVVTGTVIDIPGRRLMVEEACSGINSLLSVVAVTLLFAFIRRRRPGAILGLLVAAVVFVFWANVARIVCGAVLLGRCRVDLFDNSLHALSGLALFVVCLLLVASTDQLLQSLGHRRRHQGGPNDTSTQAEAPAPAKANSEFDLDPTPSTGVPLTSILSIPSPYWWAFAVVFAAVGIFNHYRLKDCWLPSSLDPAAVFSPPLAVGDWTLVPEASFARERTESFAKYSKRWFYRDGRTVAEVSLAYPFYDGQHDPAACYAAAGWDVGGRADRPAPGDGGRVSERHLTKLATSRGHLLYGSFDENGRWLGPQADPPAGEKRWATALRLSREVALARPTQEVQTLIVTSADLGPAEKAKAEELFLAVSRSLNQQVTAQVKNRDTGGRS